MKDSKGFAIIESLLILVILGILAGTGWYVWHSKSDANKSYSNASSVGNIVTKNATSSGAQQSPASWKSYCSVAENMCFNYPPSWKIDKVNSGIKEGVFVTDPSRSLLITYSPLFNVGETSNLNSHSPVAIDSLNHPVDKLKLIEDVFSAQVDRGHGPETDYWPVIYIVSNDFIDSLNLKVGEITKEIDYYNQYTKLKPVPGLTDISHFEVEGGPFGGPQLSFSGFKEAKQWFGKSEVIMAKKVLLSAEYK